MSTSRAPAAAVSVVIRRVELGTRQGDGGGGSGGGGGRSELLIHVIYLKKIVSR